MVLAERTTTMTTAKTTMTTTRRKGNDNSRRGSLGNRGLAQKDDANEVGDGFDGAPPGKVPGPPPNNGKKQNDGGNEANNSDNGEKKKKKQQQQAEEKKKKKDPEAQSGISERSQELEPTTSNTSLKDSNDKKTICPDGTECQNGSVCVLGEGDKAVCDCSAMKGKWYAGKQCEYVATSFCNEASSRKQQTESAPSFCTNHGTCAPSVDGEDPTCLCSAPFHGPHCELKQASFGQSLRHDAKVAAVETKVFLEELDGVSVMGIIAGALVVGLLLGYCCTHRKGCCRRWGCCCCCKHRSARRKKIKRSMILAQYRRLSEKDPLMKEGSSPGRRPNFWDEEEDAQNLSLDDSHDDSLDDDSA